MIQRIQSLFLALAGLSGFSLFLEPMDFARVQNAVGIEQTMLGDGVLDIQDNPLLLGLTVVLSLLPVLAIFLFKKRKWQLNVGRIAIIASIALLLAAGFFYYQDSTLLKDAQPSISFGVASPVLSLVFLFFARKYIRKDEALVRSADRLR